MKKLPLLFLIVFVSACTKDRMPVTDDVFAFGTGYGECSGDCARLYQISQAKLYPDNISNFYNGQVTFSTTPLPDSSYQHAKSLPAMIPQYLLLHPNETLGCPDCY